VEYSWVKPLVVSFISSLPHMPLINNVEELSGSGEACRVFEFEF